MNEPIRSSEIPQSPRDALELLRRVPDAKNVSRIAYVRAIELLETFINQETTRWTD